jgi:hypothetical protein
MENAMELQYHQVIFEQKEARNGTLARAYRQDQAVVFPHVGLLSYEKVGHQKSGSKQANSRTQPAELAK